MQTWRNHQHHHWNHHHWQQCNFHLQEIFLSLLIGTIFQAVDASVLEEFDILGKVFEHVVDGGDCLVSPSFELTSAFSFLIIFVFILWYPSIHLSLYPFIHPQRIHPFTYQFIYQFIHLFVYVLNRCLDSLNIVQVWFQRKIGSEAWHLFLLTIFGLYDWNVCLLGKFS